MLADSEIKHQKEREKQAKKHQTAIEKQAKKHQTAIEKHVGDKTRMKKQITELKKKNRKLERLLKAASHPSNKSSLKLFEPKKNKAKPETARKQGGQPNHRGNKKETNIDRTSHNRAKTCKKCGSGNVKNRKKGSRIIHHLKKVIKVETVKEITYECECNECGARFESDIPGVPEKGSYDKAVIFEIFSMFLHRMPYRRIARELQRMGIAISFATVCGILKEIGIHGLDAPARGILARIRRAKVLHVDETSISLNGDKAWIWIFLDPASNNVFYTIRKSRGADVLREILPDWNGTIVADGWSAYSKFTVQRCWAHIVRDADHLAKFYGTPAAIDLSEQLHAILGDALDASRHRDVRWRRKCVKKLDRRVADLVEQHRRNYRLAKFVTTLDNARPGLFRFVIDPGIPHTNNAAERGLRELVVHRKIRGGIRSDDTMEWLGNLFTCVSTWKERGLDVMAKMASYV